MTKQEIAARHKRISARIAEKGLAVRPVSAAEKRKFEELVQKKEALKKQSQTALRRA